MKKKILISLLLIVSLVGLTFAESFNSENLAITLIETPQPGVFENQDVEFGLVWMMGTGEDYHYFFYIQAEEETILMEPFYHFVCNPDELSVVLFNAAEQIKIKDFKNGKYSIVIEE